MTAVKLEHPTGKLLIAYGLGQLGEEELAGIDDHLANCEICRQVVEGVAPDTLLNLLCSAATEPQSAEWVAQAEPGPEAAGKAESGFKPLPTAPPPAITNHPRYRVGELLGIGGMGAVYKAEHLLMARPVALKVLNHELIDKPGTVERFRREVRAAARLTHPNIVAAFDAEQAEDVHFLVMEYVEGVSLARRIAEDGALPVAQACDAVRQAAVGLQHAHERGMVHRDIKPQNLMLTPNGQVKILDFGLARFVLESVPACAILGPEGAAASGIAVGQANTLTQTGIVMGTADYIAPEQARDSHLADIKADIYSLGCTFYHLLAGHPPFPEGNTVQKVKAHLEQPPAPLGESRPDVPPELVRIIDQMMAKDPAQRFETPAQLAAALAPFQAAPPRPPRRKIWLALAAGVFFAAALFASVIIYVQTDNGTIVIETTDPNIAVTIEKAGGVRIVDQANNREYRLRPGGQNMPSGDYRIEVNEALAGLDFQVQKFELKRGKEVRLSATFLPKGNRAIMDVELTAKEPTKSKTRLEFLKEMQAIAALKEQQSQLGTAVLEDVLAAKRDVARAELDLAESDTDRVKAHERIVALAEDLLKIREARFKAGMASLASFKQAAADLLQAQNDLNRAKTMIKAIDKGIVGKGQRDFGVELDPNTIFDMMANGKESIKIADAGLLRNSLEEWAKENKITNELITRAEFAKYFYSIIAKMEGGGLGPQFGKDDPKKKLQASYWEFGQTIDRTMNCPSSNRNPIGNDALRLEDGKLFNLPKKLALKDSKDDMASEKLKKWYNEANVNFVIDYLKETDQWVMKLRNVKFAELSESPTGSINNWKTLSANELQERFSKLEWKKAANAGTDKNEKGFYSLIFTEGMNPPMTFAFETSDGHRGILQFFAWTQTATHRNALIRYKQIQRPYGPANGKGDGG
jgi:Protein kinase domain/Outer membrane efflux protein